MGASNSAFISYRREGGFAWAKLVWDDLRDHGFDAFLDLENVRDAGNFDTKILRQIEARPYFVMVLTSGSLERCRSPGDWLRLELHHAIETDRVLVPLVIPPFEFAEADDALPPEAAHALRSTNGVRVVPDYFDAAMERLRTDRLEPIEVELRQLSPDDEEFAEDAHRRASSLPPPTPSAGTSILAAMAAVDRPGEAEPPASPPSEDAHDLAVTGDDARTSEPDRTGDTTRTAEPEPDRTGGTTRTSEPEPAARADTSQPRAGDDHRVAGASSDETPGVAPSPPPPPPSPPTPPGQPDTTEPVTAADDESTSDAAPDSSLADLVASIPPPTERDQQPEPALPPTAPDQCPSEPPTSTTPPAPADGHATASGTTPATASGPTPVTTPATASGPTPVVTSGATRAPSGGPETTAPSAAGTGGGTRRRRRGIGWLPVLIVLAAAVVGGFVAFGSLFGGDDRPADRMEAGDTLRAGDRLETESGRTVLEMTADGRLVASTDGVPWWNPNPDGTPDWVARMQGDGNFVIYRSDGPFVTENAVFSTRTQGNPGARLVLDEGADGGFATIESADGNALFREPTRGGSTPVTAPPPTQPPQPTGPDCSPDAIRPAVEARLGGEIDIIDVEVAECDNGFARAFAAPDQTGCEDPDVPCLENEQVFLRFDGDAWVAIDSGTGIDCADPAGLSPETVEACQALGLP